MVRQYQRLFKIPVYFHFKITILIGLFGVFLLNFEDFKDISPKILLILQLTFLPKSHLLMQH